MDGEGVFHVEHFEIGAELGNVPRGTSRVSPDRAWAHNGKPRTRANS